MLNKHNLNVAQFASKEESRYTLTGILVNPDSTVATNGHYLVWVSGTDRKADDYPVVPGFGKAEDKFASFILSRESALAIAKVTPSKEAIPVLNHVAIRERKLEDGDNAADRYMAITDLGNPQVFPVRPMSGTFPDYAAVVPKYEDAKFRITLNAAYLAAIAKAAAGFSSEKDANLVVSFYEDTRAVRFDATNHEQGMTAVLMPIRDNADKHGTYGWAEREAVREAARAEEEAKRAEDAAAEGNTDAEEKAAASTVENASADAGE